MADFVSELASKVGISEETARKGVGIVLGLLKKKLPAETFSKVSEAVPEADSMTAEAADTPEQATGMAGALKGAFGKIFGAGATETLLARFAQIGMSPDQIQRFIPTVMEFLKSRLPENVFNQISGLLPVPHEVAH
jgi:hypothetical protein